MSMGSPVEALVLSHTQIHGLFAFLGVLVWLVGLKIAHFQVED